MQRITRLKRELVMLQESPPHGICCWQEDSNNMNTIKAQLIGNEDTPYAGGIFTIDIAIPERYPFEPPKLRFITPIYHPNIDSGGRICLDTLKMPPQLLMAEPNPDDPLMADIAKEYKHNQHRFVENAKHWTLKHAVNKAEHNSLRRKSSSAKSDCGPMCIQEEQTSIPQCSGSSSNARKRESVEKNCENMSSFKKTRGHY
ncbi:ubiquitin-conjugating enzyme E2 T-like isoform X2 [Clavelina lepadiformis]|uniref:ubiquitin-conjugating enzyme E2 T-like isoform X2 n=1 Tax=Clavelina lepadiformis TaxID=159417 RepID=UPI0040424A7D